MNIRLSKRRQSDAGFEYDEKYLASVFDASKGRRAIGFKYCANSGEDYNIDSAIKQIEADARKFVEERKAVFKTIAKTGNYKLPISVFACSSEIFGKEWSEGILWLEEVFKIINSNIELDAILPVDAANSSEQLYTVNPFFSSIFESGYAAELLNRESDWMYSFVLKTTKKMLDLVRMFPKGDSLLDRILNAAAREILLLQSYYWPLYASESKYKEFAEQRFVEHIQSFSQAYESLGADTPDTRWLTERENKFPIFEDINYRIFSKKI